MATEVLAPRGRFGEYGGQFVPEPWRPAVAGLEATHRDGRADGAFVAKVRASERMAHGD